MKLVICWAEVSGYMAACWRALAKRVDLFTIAWASGQEGMTAHFTNDVMHGVPCRILNAPERHDLSLIRDLLQQHRPDVIMIPGWNCPAYVGLVRQGALGAKVIMGMDTPWRGTLRQRLAKFKLASFLRRIDRVMVPGERTWQYAMRLGVPEGRICRGLYGIDATGLSAAHAARQALPQGWPRRFLYMGRYEPVKAMDVLVEAYARYRAQVTDPWPLQCYGSGVMADRVRGQTGIEDGGFIQPAEQPAKLAQAGVFVLASRFDPWPLVVVEACAAGLPVVCTNACGSAVEMIRPYYNGLMVGPEDPAALASALRWMHQHADELPQMGQRSLTLAQAYDAPVWARRMEAICEELCAHAG